MIYRIIIVIIVISFASCEQKSSSVELPSDSLEKITKKERDAVNEIEALPEYLEGLSTGELELDTLFDKINPSYYKGEEDRIVRFVTSNARYSSGKHYGARDMLVSGETILAKYIYENYPLAEQFYKDVDGTLMLNLEELVDAWRFIPEPKCE